MELRDGRMILLKLLFRNNEGSFPTEKLKVPLCKL